MIYILFWEIRCSCSLKFCHFKCECNFNHYLFRTTFTRASTTFLGPHIHGQPQLTIPNPSKLRAFHISQGRGSTVPSVSAEASSPAGINSTHLIFSVLQANNVILKENSVLSALTSWTVSAEASSSAGINSTHLIFSVLQVTMLSLKKLMCCLLWLRHKQFPWQSQVQRY